MDKIFKKIILFSFVVLCSCVTTKSGTSVVSNKNDTSIGVKKEAGKNLKNINAKETKEDIKAYTLLQAKLLSKKSVVQWKTGVNKFYNGNYKCVENCNNGTILSNAIDLRIENDIMSFKRTDSLYKDNPYPLKGKLKKDKFYWVLEPYIDKKDENIEEKYKKFNNILFLAKDGDTESFWILEKRYKGWSKFIKY